MQKSCTIHENISTNVSCSVCEKPICTKCMVYAPVGIKCKNCATSPNVLGIRRYTLTLILLLSTLVSYPLYFLTIWLIPIYNFPFIGIVYILPAVITSVLALRIFKTGLYYKSRIMVLTGVCVGFIASWGTYFLFAGTPPMILIWHWLTIIFGLLFILRR